MLDQDTDKAFNGTEYHPVDHNGSVLLAVRPDILQFKPLGQLEIQLDGAALPGSADAVHQMEVDLGAIESAVPFVDHIRQLHFFQRFPQGVCRHLPVLVASHGIFRPGGQFHMIFKPEQGINLVDQFHHALDFILDLLRGHENVGVVLGKTAHPHQAVQLAGLFMAVHQSQLAHAQGQIPVGTGFGRINQNAAGAVHGLHRIVFPVDYRGVHVVFIMIPVSGSLPEAPV